MSEEMTREQAKRVLDNMYGDWRTDEEREALSVAIAALEAQVADKEVLQEIRQKIDGLRYDHLIGNVSNYAVIDVALEIIDAHIAEEQG